MKRTYQVSADKKTIETLDNLLSMLHHSDKRKVTFAFEFDGDSQEAEVSPLPTSALSDQLDEEWDFLPRICNCVILDEDGFKGGEMRLVEDGKALHTAATGTAATLPSARAAATEEDEEEEENKKTDEEDPELAKIKKIHETKIDPSLLVAAWPDVKGFVDVSKLAECEGSLDAYFAQDIDKIKDGLRTHCIEGTVFQLLEETSLNFYESKDPKGGEEGDVEYDIPLNDFSGIGEGQIFNQIEIVSENWEKDKFIGSINDRALLWFSDGWVFHLDWNLDSREKYGDLRGA